MALVGNTDARCSTGEGGGGKGRGASMRACARICASLCPTAPNILVTPLPWSKPGCILK